MFASTARTSPNQLIPRMLPFHRFRLLISHGQLVRVIIYLTYHEQRAIFATWNT